jgi:signal peptidase I
MIKAVWRTAKLVPVVIAVEDVLYGPASVHGRSMQPTFNPDSGAGNDLVLADKWSIKLYRYSRGDVVLLRCPHRIPSSTLCHPVYNLHGCLLPFECQYATHAHRPRCLGACRSPEDPDMTLIKRLLALEGDWVTIPGSLELAKIPKVCWTTNLQIDPDSALCHGCC